MILLDCVRKRVYAYTIVLSSSRKHRHSISVWYPGLVQKYSTVNHSVA